MKVKSFFKTKGMVDRTKWQPSKQEKKNFTNFTPDKGLILKLYKQRLDINKPNNEIIFKNCTDVNKEISVQES